MGRVELLHLRGNIISDKVENLILDIDNCVFDSTEWEKYIPKDNSRQGWDNYHNHYYMVSPNYEMLDFLDKLHRQGLQSIYFITAREDYENMREITISQLNQVFSEYKWWNEINKYLFMRNTRDYSPSHLVKQNILHTHILYNVKIDLAIDDDLGNIAMYRNNGANAIYYDKYR